MAPTIQFLVLIASLLITPHLAAPTTDDAEIFIYLDNVGGYKFTLTTSNVTRKQENTLDSSAKGIFTYLTNLGTRQSVRYCIKNEVLTLQGTLPPNQLDVQPEDTFEVQTAIEQYLVIHNSIQKYFLEQNEDSIKPKISVEGVIKQIVDKLHPGLEYLLVKENSEELPVFAC